MPISSANQSRQLTLHEAAQQLSASGASLHQAEVMLAEAIETFELHANVKRWATEQWDGQKLPGNINRLETFIEPTDLAAWLIARAARQAAPES